jgi:uncharacterized protein (DUF1330 family)
MKQLLAVLLLCVSITAHAQSKNAYSIAEISYLNKEAYQKDLWPKIQKLVSEAGAEIVVSGTQGEAIAGISKNPDKVTVIKFKNLQHAKNFYSSKGYQDIKPLADKTIKIRLYIVESQ